MGWTLCPDRQLLFLPREYPRVIRGQLLIEAIPIHIETLNVCSFIDTILNDIAYHGPSCSLGNKTQHPVLTSIEVLENRRDQFRT